MSAAPLAEGAADPLWAQLLPEVPDAARREELLAWADRVPSDLPALEVAPWTEPADAPRPDDGVFGAVVDRVVADAVDRFAASTAALAVVGDRERVVVRARALARRTAADELLRPLVALLAADAAAGRTRGATPEERYAAWVADLLAPGGHARLAAAHPDLLPRAAALADQRLRGVLRGLEATDRHWAGLTSTLGLDPGAGLVDLEVGGDSHGGGRCVLLLTQADGGRLVHKPRSTRVEEGYAAFAAWLGEAVGVPGMARPRVHHAEDAAWVEHLHPADRPHPRFAAMVGIHLAALHLLRGTDVHYENLLTDAHGRPVVVDAEALFRPRLGDFVAHDVEATGLVGEPFGEVGFDFGALDYRAGATSPFRAWQVVHPGRDDVRLELGPVTVDHPEVVGADLRGGPAADELVAAFRRALGHAAAYGDEVRARLATDFPGGRVRLVHRATMAYALLLRTATHPRFTAERDRRRVHARLAVTAPATGPELLAAEVRQLTGGEVPAFAADLDDVRVLDARGRDTGARLAATPRADVLRALDALDEAHVARQVDRVRGLLGERVAAAGRRTAPGA